MPTNQLATFGDVRRMIIDTIVEKHKADTTFESNEAMFI